MKSKQDFTRLSIKPRFVPADRKNVRSGKSRVKRHYTLYRIFFGGKFFSMKPSVLWGWPSEQYVKSSLIPCHQFQTA